MLIKFTKRHALSSHQIGAFSYFFGNFAENPLICGKNCAFSTQLFEKMIDLQFVRNIRFFEYSNGKLSFA